MSQDNKIVLKGKKEYILNAINKCSAVGIYV